MEQIQAELAEMRAQMATQITQFMEVITNVNRRQEELAAIVNNQRRHPGDVGNQGLYQDISVGMGGRTRSSSCKFSWDAGKPFHAQRRAVSSISWTPSCREQESYSGWCKELSRSGF